MDHFALCLVMNTSRTDSGGWGITPAELDAGFHSMAALWTARAPLKIPAACEAYFFVLKSVESIHIFASLRFLPLHHYLGQEDKHAMLHQIAL